jgi:predicted O-methyltransferase YrrM
MIYQTNPSYAIDNNHIQLIHSLILSHKPKTVLEIGVGTGLVTKSVLDAFIYNQMPVDFTCVDNFCDWRGSTPIGFETFQEHIKFIQQNEKDFVLSCLNKYDFIISDADHHRTNEWVDKTYSLLNNKGILIYHDVTNRQFPNLYNIIKYVETNNIHHVVFNKSSLVTEQCERGLLVIFKS